jgi:hypothetical protein
MSAIDWEIRLRRVFDRASNRSYILHLRLVDKGVSPIRVKYG